MQAAINPIRIAPGSVIGRWSVISESPRRQYATGGAHRYFLARCVCGTERDVSMAHLRSGRSQSCGCLAVEQTVATFTTHGMYGTRPQKIWTGMIQRCHNPRATWFPRYGGRGIVVCDQWRRSFACFWTDMGPTYQPGLSIDRIDNDGNYEPENCRWATASAQGHNRGVTVHIDTPRGLLTLREIADAAGIPYATVQARVKRGWRGDDLFAPLTPKSQPRRP